MRVESVIRGLLPKPQLLGLGSESDDCVFGVVKRMPSEREQSSGTYVIPVCLRMATIGSW